MSKQVLNITSILQQNHNHLAAIINRTKAKENESLKPLPKKPA